MSSGHRHKQDHTASLIRDTYRLLETPEIQKLMNRKYRMEFIPVPLTGGSSRDGSIFYIDPDVPEKLRKYVLLHERVEKALRDAGKSYQEAHRIATCAERLLVEQDGKSWDEYKREIGAKVQANEKRGAEKMPSGFDYGPYRESGMMRLVDG